MKNSHVCLASLKKKNCYIVVHFILSLSEHWQYFGQCCIVQLVPECTHNYKTIYLLILGDGM